MPRGLIKQELAVFSGLVGYGGVQAFTQQSTEDDPGAVLSAPLEGHIIRALKWQLLCRGIKPPISWRKPQLVTRQAELSSIFWCIFM